jgi:putative DNA primase/helicase
MRPGGGFKLLQAMRAVDFHAALFEVERCLGVLPAEAARNWCPCGTRRAHAPADAAHLGGSAAVVAGDEVDR